MIGNQSAAGPEPAILQTEHESSPVQITRKGETEDIAIGVDAFFDGWKSRQFAFDTAFQLDFAIVMSMVKD